MKTIILSDKFNGVEISKHRTVANAVKARIKFVKLLRKHNGQGCYLMSEITASDGSDIEEEVYAAEYAEYAGTNA